MWLIKSIGALGLEVGANPLRLIVLAAFAVASLGGCKSPPKMERLVFNCSTDAECAALPPCALKPGCDGGPDTQPYRLVGYDCKGFSTPIYRDEEDEFPTKCGAIEGTFGQ